MPREGGQRNAAPRFPDGRLNASVGPNARHAEPKEIAVGGRPGPPAGRRPAATARAVGIGGPRADTIAWIERRSAATRHTSYADFAARAGHERAFAKSFSVCAAQITRALAAPGAGGPATIRAIANNRDLPRPSRSPPGRRVAAPGVPIGRSERSPTGRTTVLPRHVARPARSADLRFLPPSTAPSKTDAYQHDEIIDAP